jgi:hypothetical protein
MVIYNIKQTCQGLFSNFDEEDYWTLNPPENAKIIRSNEIESRRYNILYAIAYNLDEINPQKLLEIMHKELTKKEAEEICKNDEFIKEMYFNSLSKQNSSSEKEKSLNDAEFIASIALLHSMLK